ncbi:MAG: AtpZ/AtpI family protein [Candidatus Omnitrophica bacterium]|jgi:F0F1-type ATP synthase assembly protein I|nr:AtpZ/AtpI family protein [Candidatus Omnitrophota bacterium]
MQKEDLYKGIKTVGFVSFIPFMLAAGPLSGYFVGDFLQKKFNLSRWIVLFGIVFGFLAAIIEIVKILKAIGRVSKK